MFRHKGKNRTYFHNLELASALSFVAGIVNIVGVLSIKILTTNITGHFAFFSEEMLLENYYVAFVYLLFILSFLIGAFTSSFIVELSFGYKKIRPHLIPLIIEILIFTLIGLSDFKSFGITISSHMIACFLLFTMGSQNALVTRVSQSVVRTTHLTGLFTDLGIDLSKFFFEKREVVFHQIKKNIILKVVIIICFFSGCIIGGFLYKVFSLKALLFTAGLLFFIVRYDRIIYQYYILKRKIKIKKITIRK
ncbi:DUF1275 domain-containing protein [Elizabethkingia anophelis]|uniref:YoaK family protein n=1 Tax=Elizabethkingia anophelis TaxID=1117645 RepID=UPI0013688DCE|nr:YoaK family protein [Elizabethkingia anophelis]MYZ61803.1 DUF1275 domain-containing protein [Elizabethkingia anophelis]